MKKVMILMMILATLFSGSAFARDTLTEPEKKAIVKAVKKELKDPDSAKFKWVRMTQNIDTKSNYTHIPYCGLVNSKNSYGGYVGDQPFIAYLSWNKGKLIDLGAGMMDTVEQSIKVCREAGYTDFSSAE